MPVKNRGKPFIKNILPVKLSDKPVYLVLPLILYMCIFYAYPLLRMLVMSFFSPEFTFKHYFAFFEGNYYLFSLFVTFKISILVTFLCLLLGYPLAFYLSSIPSKNANILLVFVLIPLWTSLLVRTYSWMMILGKNGILNQTFIKLALIEHPLKLIYNTLGVTIGMVHVMMPFMVLSLFSVMLGIDRSLLKAAQNLGARPFEAFRRIFLPLSMPGIYAGCLLVFIISVGFFVTPAFLGGRKEIMISMVIDQAVSNLLNWGFGSAASFILLLIVVVLFLVSGKIIGLDKLWGGKV